MDSQARFFEVPKVVRRFARLEAATALLCFRGSGRGRLEDTAGGAELSRYNGREKSLELSPFPFFSPLSEAGGARSGKTTCNHCGAQALAIAAVAVCLYK